ncbi:MAG: hypothetical protein AAF696_19500, partial [Bacteroidota bacterium]
FSLYEGDNSMIELSRTVLKFYLMEAEEKLPVISDFYLKKDNFERIKTVIDGKKAKDRSQEDIDTYNTAVNEYNQAVQEFNATNEELNGMRAKMIKLWNKTSDSFIDRHVP